MRTTIDLPDDVFRQLKAEAALRGVKLKDFILKAVRQALGSAPPPPGAAPRLKLPLVKSKRPGRLAPTNADLQEFLR